MLPSLQLSAVSTQSASAAQLGNSIAQSTSFLQAGNAALSKDVVALQELLKKLQGDK